MENFTHVEESQPQTKKILNVNQKVNWDCVNSHLMIFTLNKTKPTGFLITIMNKKILKPVLS